METRVPPAVTSCVLAVDYSALLPGEDPTPIGPSAATEDTSHSSKPQMPLESRPKLPRR